MVAVAMTYYFLAPALYRLFINTVSINQSILITYVLILQYKLQAQDKFYIFQKPTFTILSLPSLFFMLDVMCAFVLVNCTVVRNKEYV